MNFRGALPCREDVPRSRVNEIACGLPPGELGRFDVIISELTRDSPPAFVEFGFHPIEFNCIQLAYPALLVDGSKRQVEDARVLWPRRLDIT